MVASTLTYFALMENSFQTTGLQVLLKKYPQAPGAQLLLKLLIKFKSGLKNYYTLLPSFLNNLATEY